MHCVIQGLHRNEATVYIWTCGKIKIVQVRIITLRMHRSLGIPTVKGGVQESTECGKYRRKSRFVAIKEPNELDGNGI